MRDRIIQGYLLGLLRAFRLLFVLSRSVINQQSHKKREKKQQKKRRNNPNISWVRTWLFMISATPKILMMLLAPESRIKLCLKWKACFLAEQPQTASGRRSSGGAWGEPISPGSELCSGLQRRQLLGDIWAGPFPPLYWVPFSRSPLRL